MQIKDKVAIVTGGSNGFGAALVRRLIHEGARVIIGDIDKKAGQELETELNKNNKINAIFVFCDVTNFEHLRQLFEIAQNKFGGVDVSIVCNNAGIAQENEFYDQTDRWVNTININLNAVIKGTQLAIQFMKKRGGGVIVNTASMSAFYPLTVAPVYSSTKRAVVGFTQSLRDLNDTDKIRVNAIAPSFVATRLTQEMKSKQFEEMIKKTGYVHIDEVINAFIMAIQDDKFAGDIIMVPKTNRLKILPRSSL
ncbi:7704_t:CDS:2 [Dentiscutata heterogama]|uniref:7704_t:CDS:1 n=1 Tax=Dentiscutata heterogama TaxID=1316150 RepID=A0ACA9JVC2_9GLOM|nr:7704_t:CDS:2 [Dentiscutata heterogama]